MTTVPYAQVREELDRVKAERDALLAALEAMVNRFGHEAWSSVHDAAAVNDALRILRQIKGA